jgi:hypothetical protein
VSRAADHRPPYLAVGLLSGAALAYEVLLTRLFAAIQWHHFAYMIISVAMLGWGAAGTLVALLGEGPQHRFRAAFAGAAALFGAGAIGCFLLAQAIAFNPLEAFWDARQFLRLALVYLCLFLPFLAAAAALCLAFSRCGAQAPRLYAADILGAGLGALAVVGLLWLVPPMRVLALLGALGFVAGGLVWGPRRPGGLALLAAAVLAAGLPAAWLALRPSEYKDLSQTLEVTGTRVVAAVSGPLGSIAVVESPRVPFRHAPGLSLSLAEEPPPQLGAFIDGDGLVPIDRFDGDMRPLAYLDGLTSALPYHLLQRPRVLVLGAGGGREVLQALYHRAALVDAVAVNAQLLALVDEPLAEFSGRPFRQPGVRVHVADARTYVAGSRERYDLIQIALVDSFAGSAAGLGALSENYLYTVEALQAYLARLAPDGLLAITRWIDLPPRDLPKLAATAIAALEAQGVTDPGRRLALIRGLKTGTLLVKNGEFTPAQIEALRRFSRARSFDVAWYPGMRAEEANRYNRLERPYFHEAMVALLGPGRADFMARYKYRLEPATDDRPHFFHFFKWESLGEWIALRARGGVTLMEWGYPVLLATLVQALLAGVALILLPLALAGARVTGGAGRGATFAYFALLGLAFMFMEIAFIQRFMLFLGHPLHAVAVVLAGFLIFAGLGSRLSGALPGDAGRIARFAAAAVALVGFAYLFLLPPLFQALAGLPDAARIAFGLALIAPLALAMGMPFPLGLRALSAAAPGLIPWAWGINASVSVAAAVLASLLAVHLGFTAVVALASLGYLAASAAFPGPFHDVDAPAPRLVRER